MFTFWQFDLEHPVVHLGETHCIKLIHRNKNIPAECMCLREDVICMTYVHIRDSGKRTDWDTTACWRSIFPGLNDLAFGSGPPLKVLENRNRKINPEFIISKVQKNMYFDQTFIFKISKCLIIKIGLSQKFSLNMKN